MCGWTSTSGKDVFERLQTGSIGTSRSCWTSPMHTRKRRCTYEELAPITMVQPPLPPRRASVNTTTRSSGTCILRRTEPQTCHFSGGKLWTPRGRRHQLHRPARSLRRGGEEWRVDDKEGGEGPPAPYHLGDYTGGHFEEGVAFQTPASGPPRSKEEQERSACQTHPDGVAGGRFFVFEGTPRIIQRRPS